MITTQRYCYDISDTDWIELLVKVEWGNEDVSGSCLDGPYIKNVETWRLDTGKKFYLPESEWGMLNYEQVQRSISYAGA